MRTPRLFLTVVAAICITLLPRCGARTALPSDEQESLDAAAAGCAPGSVTLRRANPTVMFVLDRSKSMDSELSSSSGQSRWELLSSALADALPSIDSAVGLGLLMFPSSQESQSCSVAAAADLNPATGNVTSLLALVQSASPGGATPTANAIDAAAKVLVGIRTATTARAMVLATDGGPDCNDSLDPDTCECVSGTCSSSTRCLDDARTIERIAYYQADGIPTYVIGIQDDDDTSLTAVLDSMADAGGHAQSGGAQKYYAARSETELNAALVAIRDQVGSCTYLMESVPGEGASVTVRLDGATIPQDGTGKGWAWGAESNGEIVLVGTTCTATAGEQSPVLVAEVACSDE